MGENGAGKSPLIKIVARHGTGGCQPTVRQGCELQAIATVVIGAASLQGGEGSATGTLIAIHYRAAFEWERLAGHQSVLAADSYWRGDYRRGRD
jgi:hypothetical protein